MAAVVLFSSAHCSPIKNENTKESKSRDISIAGG